MQKIENREKLRNTLLKAKLIKMGQLIHWVDGNGVDDEPFILLEVLRSLPFRTKVLNREALSIRDAMELNEFVRCAIQKESYKPLEDHKDKISYSYEDAVARDKYYNLIKSGQINPEKIGYAEFIDYVTERGYDKGKKLFLSKSNPSLGDLYVTEFVHPRSSLYFYIKPVKTGYSMRLVTAYGVITKGANTLEKVLRIVNENLEDFNPIGREPFVMEDIHMKLEKFKNIQSNQPVAIPYEGWDKSINVKFLKLGRVEKHKKHKVTKREEELV